MADSVTYDVIVVGAGPGGSTAASFMAQKGLQVLLIDKSDFPRDRVCGDAISGKSVDVLRRLDLIDEVRAAEHIGAWGVTFGGPNGEAAAIPFTSDRQRTVPPGFVCAREVFDDIVLRKARQSGADVHLGVSVTDLLLEGSAIRGVVVDSAGGTRQIRAPLVIGADGAYSIVARKLGIAQLNERHYSAGLRAYYRGVTGFHEDNHIELHFLADAIPGYFWIFPMSNGMANVGVGMLSAAVKKRKVKLRVLLDQCIAHPQFRERFEGAERIGRLKGWGLPLGSSPRPMAGDGWMLVGDAASLIDPFTGEGIGNAMISGEKAASWSERAIEASRFDAEFLHGYQRDVMSYLGGELRVSHGMQRLINFKWLLGLVIGKAERNPYVASTISVMFDDESERKKLLKPQFYLRLLRS